MCGARSPRLDSPRGSTGSPPTGLPDTDGPTHSTLQSPCGELSLGSTAMHSIAILSIGPCSYQYYYDTRMSDATFRSRGAHGQAEIQTSRQTIQTIQPELVPSSSSVNLHISPELIIR